MDDSVSSTPLDASTTVAGAGKRPNEGAPASVAYQADRNRRATIARDVYLFLVAFRVLNAFCVRTFFQPDEYFQSLEPAWQIAFGEESGAWITWVRFHPPICIDPMLMQSR
jgi:GPI mannosyltransferase 3